MSEEPREHEEELSEEERARRAFIEGLRERGEAAEPDENGELPPGATHEIVKKGPGEPPEVRRRRFSLS